MNGCSRPNGTIFSPRFVRSEKLSASRLVDLTTGDFMTTELESEAALLTELERLRPAEIIYPQPRTLAVRETLAQTALVSDPAIGYEDWVFAPETALFTVRDISKSPRSMASG